MKLPPEEEGRIIAQGRIDVNDEISTTSAYQQLRQGMKNFRPP
jgi:hypothetical protein